MMSLRKLGLVLFALSQSLLCLYGVNYPSGGDGNGTSLNPQFSLTEDSDLLIDLDGNATGGFENWIFISGPY